MPSIIKVLPKNLTKFKRNKDPFIDQWLDESHSCKAYILFNDNKKMITFALLSKMDFDPMNE